MIPVCACGITKTFGRVRALDDVSLEIQRGELFFLLGPSGCGKTTLLRTIAGFYPPDAGRVLFGDIDVTHLAPQKRNTGMVFQNAALWPHMTVSENILFGIARQDRQGAARRIGDLLEMLEIDSLRRRYPRQLSGGQARRVAIARALAPSPQLLLLDEPFTNMDERLRCEVLAGIRSEYEKQGFAMLLVTHDLNEARALPGSVWQLTGGTVEIMPDHPAGASRA